MSAPVYSNVILELANEIDLLTKTFVYQGYQALANALAGPLSALCVLYIAVMGYGIIRGIIKQPMQEFINSMVRMGLIFMFALNWGYFSQFVAELFTTATSQLGAIMMNLIPGKVPLYKGQGVNGGLQSVFIEVVRVGAWVWDTGTLRHPGPFFTAALVFAAGIAVVGLAFFELIVAKLMLSICLCTAPLFIIFTLFAKTRSFFDQWLGKLVGFSLVIFFVSTVVGFCMHLLHWSIGSHFQNHASDFRAVDWIPLCICAALGVMAILEVVNIAKSIGGSCCTSSGSSMVGGFIGGAMGAFAAGGATKLIGNKTLKAGRELLPGGNVYDAGKSITKYAFSKGGQSLKAIQQRMRGSQK